MPDAIAAVAYGQVRGISRVRQFCGPDVSGPLEEGMRTDLDTWRRQYRKARDAFKGLARSGSPLTFSISGDVEAGTLDVRADAPPSEVMVRFVAVMRPFTLKVSPLHWEATWDDLRSHVPPVVIPEDVAAVDGRVAEIKRGAMELSVNDQMIMAERLAEIVSAGSVFDDEEWARGAMIELTQDPLLGPFAWHTFYNFNVDVLELLGALYPVLEVVRREQDAAESDPEPCCIFCLETKGPFTSRDHVYPEALGNSQYILERGIVCDSCNHANGVVERKFIEFEPIALLRTYAVPFTKQGKFPTARMGDTRIERKGPREVVWTLPAGQTPVPNGVDETGRHAFSLESTFRPRTRPRDVARALFKMALASIAYERGASIARSPRYHDARAFIRQGGPFANVMLMDQAFRPHTTMETQTGPDELGSFVRFDIFGARFLINIETEPVVTLPAQLAELGWKAYRLDAEPHW